MPCYHAQQAVEKVLKAALIFAQIGFAFRHDLDFLRDLLPPNWNVKRQYPDLSVLTQWAVEARYPSDLPDATKADARVAVRQARAIYESVCTNLAAHGLTLYFVHL